MKKLLTMLLALLMMLGVTPCLADFQECQLTELYTCTYMVENTFSEIAGRDVVEIEYLRSAVPVGPGAWAGLDVEVDLVIPEALDDYPVVSIWRGAIDNSLIPGKIVSVTLPDSLMYMHDTALSGCGYLTEIIVSPDHPYFEVIDGVLFDKLEKKLLCYPAAKSDETYTIPEGTLAIAERAFFGNDILSEIIIPDSVTTIGKNAFRECYALTSLTIGSGVTEFPAHELSAGIRYETSIESTESPFLFSMALQEINVSPDNPTYMSIDGVLFDKSGTTLLCYPMAREAAYYAIPDGVTAIGPDAFPVSSAVISLPDCFVFTQGEQREVYIYPIAMTDERMQAFLNAEGLNSKNKRTLKDGYKQYDSKSSEELKAAFPALAEGTPLWIERQAAKGNELKENQQLKLADAWAAAGYTADDLLIDDANLASGPRTLYPYTVVCEQLTADSFPTGCTLLVEEDSLQHHWAVQNGIAVVFDAE